MTTSRERFEDWYSGGWEYPAAVERDGEGYKLAGANSSWEAWDAGLCSIGDSESHWVPIDMAEKNSVNVVDLWSGGRRYSDCVWSKPTYGSEPCWVQLNASHDCNGPVDEVVKNPTHFMRPPSAPGTVVRPQSAGSWGS